MSKTERNSKGFKDGEEIALRWEFPSCLNCRNLGLTHLEISEDDDLISVRCVGNNLGTYEFPEFIKYVHCDKELFDYDTCKTPCVFIYYR